MSKQYKGLALKHCANWDAGSCIGAMISYVRHEGLKTTIDSEMAGKECFVSEEDRCLYFDEIVTPGIPDDKIYKRRKKADKDSFKDDR